MLTNIEHRSLNVYQKRTLESKCSPTSNIGVQQNRTLESQCSPTLEFSKNEHWSRNAHQHRTLEFTRNKHWSRNADQHRTLESQCSPTSNIGATGARSPKQNRTASASLPRKISAAQSGDPTQHCLLSYCAAVLVKVIPASRVPGADMFDAACKASLQAEQVWTGLSTILRSFHSKRHLG